MSTRIIQGVIDFQQNVQPGKRSLFRKLADGQQPLAVFITCADSRINPNLLTQTEPGELFILRNAGNIVPPAGAGAYGEEATVEYALKALGIRDIIVCGHYQCGAMDGLLKLDQLGDMPTVAAWLELAKPALNGLDRGTAGDDSALLDRVIQQNVLQQLENLKTYPAVQQRIAQSALRLHAWVYRFETGEVEAYDPIEGAFVPLPQAPRQEMLDRQGNEDKRGASI